MKLTKREIILLIFALFIIAGALYYNCFLLPQLKEIELFQKEAASQNDKLLFLKMQAQEIVKLRKKITQLEAELEERCLDIPVGFDQPSVVVYLEDMLKPLGEKSSLAFQDIEDKGIYNIAKVKVTLKANYAEFLRILEELEKAPYRNQIESLKVASSLSGQTITDAPSVQQFEINAELDLGFYFLPGTVDAEKTYPFMHGKYNKPNLFS